MLNLHISDRAAKIFQISTMNAVICRYPSLIAYRSPHPSAWDELHNAWQSTSTPPRRTKVVIRGELHSAIYFDSTPSFIIAPSFLSPFRYFDFCIRRIGRCRACTASPRPRAKLRSVADRSRLHRHVQKVSSSTSDSWLLLSKKSVSNRVPSGTLERKRYFWRGQKERVSGLEREDDLLRGIGDKG